ncbi:10238_t:CDS:2 [Ambispora gerdemannii]|uniref:10238_t:CDS:1 n=1 Tax=Ambispora gerdemannii TaxID=144530 RepID=A0A9N8WJU0_9GLOM|nr:10238_t:CDS:2 [Ambispora gerdemannii]
MDAFEKYYLDFVNEVPNEILTFGVYQTYPNTPGIDAVAWLRADVPENGFSGVSFAKTYCVVNANYDNPEAKGRYASCQVLDTTLGTSWEIVEKNGVAQFNDKHVGDSNDDDLIVIKNLSRSIASLGVGMSGKLAAIKKRVYVGATAAFKINPIYYVGIFADLEVGTV